ncbi:MAG: hypothetical protein C4320_00130 [Armatimonadota bacterium]
MNESRIWLAVLAVATLCLFIIGRDLVENRDVKGVGRRVDISPDLLTNGRVPMYDSANADYMLVEFMDYQCHPCQKMGLKLQPVLARPNFAPIIRQYPLFRVHPFAERAARFALSVNDGPDSRAIHESLFRLRGSEDDWRDFLRNHANKRVRSAEEVDKRLKEDLLAAKAANVQGTPQLFLIHGRNVYEVTSPELLVNL